MIKEFNKRRRQVFLTEEYERSFVATLTRWNDELNANLQRPELGLENLSLEGAQLADNSYQLVSVRYTAGQPIEQLRAELPGVIEAYERYQQALATFEDIPKIAPLGMGNIGDYERCMQLIGLCYLLHRRDLLPRIAALQDPGYANADALYEELLDYALPDRYETDSMLHIELYDPLVHAMYADTDDERVEDLKGYLLAWYPAFKYVPWHNGHLRIHGTEGDYFGYWAFEAGAVALLCDIDDSTIDHMVYPRDLVAWARANQHLSEPDEAGASRLRCEGGQPCPQAGFWATPARANSRRRFEAGEWMPVIEGSGWGATVWYRDDTHE